MISGRSLVVFRPISGMRRRAFFSESDVCLARDYAVQINFLRRPFGPWAGGRGRLRGYPVGSLPSTQTSFSNEALLKR